MPEQSRTGSVMPRKRRFRQYFLLFCLLLLVQILLLPLLIHLRPVQNWLVDKAAARISMKSGAAVTIDEIDFSIYKGLEFNKVFISEIDSQDTLAYIGSFSSSLDQNLLSLFKQGVFLDRIYLEDANIHIRTSTDFELSNLEKFLLKLSSEKEASISEGKSWDLSLKAVQLKNITLKVNDDNKGSVFEAQLNDGSVEIKSIDLSEREFVLGEVFVDQPRVLIVKANGEHKRADTVIGHEVEEQTIAEAPADFLLDVEKLRIIGGVFQLHDSADKGLRENGGFDIDDLNILDINLDADSILFKSPINLQSRINAMTLKEAGGLDINKFSVGELQVSEQEMVLDGFEFETENSKLGDRLIFSYDGFESFKSFATEIEIEADLVSSSLAFKDMLYFFPALATNSFVRLNRHKKLKMTGDIYGTVDELESDDLYLSFSDEVVMQGALSTYALTNPDKALINLHVEEFKTSLVDLKKIIPDFDPPAQYYKLDPFVFTGDIDGFFKDFVLFGTLESKLGKADLDIRLDIKKGIEQAKYYGELQLEDFDLRTWSDNPDLGKATFYAEISDGKGLSLNNLEADIAAELERFDYKGYTYRDVKLDGEIQENLFNGILSSSDPNAKLDFEGSIDLHQGNISSDFETRIANIDLRALNLSKDFSKIQGDVNLSFEGAELDQLIGSAEIKQLSLIYKGKSFRFDSLYVSSSPQEEGNRNVIVSSDLINGSINGRFDFNELIPSLTNIIRTAHPGWAKVLDLPQRRQLTNIQDFRYKLGIVDTKDYLELAGVSDLQLQNVDLNGYVNSASDSYLCNLSISELLYKNVKVEQFELGLLEVDQKIEQVLKSEQISIGGLDINPIAIESDLIGDQLLVRIRTEELLDSIESLDLTIEVHPEGEDVVVHFRETDLHMFSSKWDIDARNEIVLGNKTIRIDHFLLEDRIRSISIMDIAGKGIDAKLSQFDFLLINSIIDYDKIQFAGRGDLILRKNNLFERSVMEVDMWIPEFTLNDVDYGGLSVSAFEVTKDSILANVLLERKDDGLILDVDAGYNTKSKVLAGKLKARNIVMNTFEFIIDDGISNTTGVANVDAIVSGTLDDIVLDGKAQIIGGSTVIDYLGARIDMGQDTFVVTDKVIDLTGGRLYDKLGNQAIMTGGLNHELFTDFTSSLSMSSPYFLALDTEKFDNPSYYGTGIGDMTVSFNGPFSSTDIAVRAITGSGTMISIPVGDTYENFDQSFIKVVDRDLVLQNIKDTLETKLKRLEGVDVELDLTITNDAKINIIFDENTNDVIKGVGRGNMRVVMARKGDFNIFGEYVIESGEYLFTYFGGIISKPFTIKEGGVITWTGDPINANINLEANYEKLRAPLNVFLAEYLIESSSSSNDAKQRTDIGLKMFLTGTLYKPEVNFDIQFPELQGEVKTLAESKMRILRENEADLNEQVAGLIMFGSFLPSTTLGSTVGSTAGLARTGYNTLSEMVSNQLSYLLSGFLQEALTDNGFVSGIDFDLGISKSTAFGDDINPDATSSIIPDEIEVHLKPRFQNDRWEIDYGTSYVNRVDSEIEYLIHDFVISFFLTDDRRLKMKAYGKWDRDFSDQPEKKYGLGLNYRKEFGSLIELKQSLTKDIGRLKPSGFNNN